MNTIAFDFMLAAAGNGQSHAITGLITAVIYIVAVVGGLALFYSWSSVRREREALKWVEDKVSTRKLGLVTLRKEILEREDQTEMPYLESSLVYSRLKEIERVLSRGKKKKDDEVAEKQITPPQLQDLHRVTLQEMQSRTAPTWLRITTSVLLIIGICGTLWGVHECIGNQHGASSQLSALSDALNPSKNAVFFTILLYIGQSLYLMGLERFICYLDRLTMTKFLPDLQPASSFTQIMQQISERVLQFGEFISGFGSIESTVEKMQDTATKFTEIADGYEQRSLVIKENLDAIKGTGESIEKEYQRLSQEVQSASDSVNSLALSLETAMKREEEVASAAESFAALLENLKSHIATVENAAGLVVATQQSLSSLTEGAASLTPLTDSVVELGQNCRQLKEQVATTSEVTGNMTAVISGEVQRLQGAFEGLEAEVRKTTGDVEQMSANAEEFKQYADEMKTKMRETLETGKAAISEQAEHQSDMQDKLQSLNDTFGRLNAAVRGK